jgi:ferredoxin
MHVTVDVNRCCGAGRCVRTAPDVFEQSESDGLVRLLDAQPPGTREADVWAAADLCPVRAISVRRD